MTSLPRLAALLLALVATTPVATADVQITIGHSQLVVTARASCGCPIHSRQVCTGHDHHHRPAYKSYRQPFICGCNKGSNHASALRKFHERRDNEYHNNRERLQKVERDYQKDLEKVHHKHQRELADQYRDFLRATD